MARNPVHEDPEMYARILTSPLIGEANQNDQMNIWLKEFVDTQPIRANPALPSQELLWQFQNALPIRWPNK